MPVYIGDYLADTMHLTTGEHGAYLLLIFAYWRKGGPLVDDDGELASICRAQPREWKRMRERIGRFFQIGDGYWLHKRIERELDRCQEISNKRSDAGAIGAAKRWQTHSKPMASAIANGEQNDANHNHSHITSSLRSEVGDGKPQRATRLDPAWEPSPEDRAFAEQLGLQTDAIWPEYRDYWIGAPGARGTKRDWPATWRNHCRRVAERAASNAQRVGRPQHRQGPNSLIAAARAVAAQIEGEQ